MLGSLLGFISPFKNYLLIAGGVAVAVTIGWLWLAKGSLEDDLADANEEIGTITEQRDKAVERANENAAALARYQRDSEAAMAALERQHEEELARRETVRVIVREIENAPETDDGPVSPVLLHAVGAVSRLRDGTEGNPGRPDHN